MKHIEIQNLKFGYTNELVLNDINFEVEEGQIVSIHGENGSGKSTLLKLILGELKASAGSVKLLGENVESIKNFREIGYVPQVQNFNDVAFPITATEFVVLNLYRDFGFFKIPKKRHKELARKTLINMGLKGYLDTPYNQLSGGFKQRTMIARAMINNPKILILDEPTAGVDQESKEGFLKLISETNKKEKITILIVTHEMSLIEKHLDISKSYKMEDGRLRLC